MGKADELRAELAVAELEEKLIEAKAAGKADQKLKAKVREARRDFRMLREDA